jgi:hypothetical protein
MDKCDQSVGVEGLLNDFEVGVARRRRRRVARQGHEEWGFRQRRPGFSGQRRQQLSASPANQLFFKSEHHMTVTITRLYSDYATASRAVNALEAGGVPAKDISLVASSVAELRSLAVREPQPSLHLWLQDPVFSGQISFRSSNS